MKVFLISGHAQHGKDTVGGFIKKIKDEEGKRSLIIHYADFLKFFCKTYLNWNGEKDQKGRTLLQQWGTNVCRANYENIWVDMMVALLKGVSTEYDYVIIPDVRFPNEVTEIQKNFNTVVLRIERPNFDNGLTLEQRHHSSEIAMDEFEEFDFTIKNDSTLDSLEQKVRNLKI